ncbi:ribosome-recycling factor, mitochondrial [Copidosoma floridanum]|uniref:ribosome-recycling factor, mitochondrial n=1 Tax=Copidosoma floridanum TaxID=29053 RepID=UPI0006C97B8F|nr:ribosome-recycling factor, mitochondrial [Copidosoma floridanum]
MHTQQTPKYPIDVSWESKQQKISNPLVRKDAVNICWLRNLSVSSSLCSKSKDRGGKEKKKQKAAKLDLRELSELIDVDEVTVEMNQAIENMKSEFIKNLNLRSATGALDQINVTVDDKVYELQELAQMSRKQKLIVLNLANFPTAIPQVIKAIETSGLNINPQQDGTTLFLPIPKVTKEHRENLAKNAKAIYIIHRDQIKDTRNVTIRELKKRKDVSEDVIRRVAAQVEALCDKYVKEAEKLLQTKQNELLGSSE